MDAMLAWAVILASDKTANITGKGSGADVI